MKFFITKRTRFRQAAMFFQNKIFFLNSIVFLTDNVNKIMDLLHTDY